jgi:hypothetical protein
MKTQQWDLAISDLTAAISLQTAGVLMLGNIKQFQALYPEYATAPDEAVSHKLNQTLYPNMKYEDFSKGFLHNEESFSSTVIPDLYLKRSDAYLKAGKWRRAANEFRRAMNGFPDPDESTRQMLTVLDAIANPRRYLSRLAIRSGERTIFLPIDDV